MNRSFGPWSTAIGTGAHPELNTFWKRRLAMLPMLGQTASRVSRRVVLLLGLLAVAALAVPTLRWTGHNPFGTPVAQGAGDPGGTSGGSTAAPAAPRGARPDGDASDPKSKVAEYLPRPTTEEERILAILERPLTVEFRDFTLEDCLQFISDFISEQGKLNLYVEKDALTDEGTPLDQPVTLKLEGRRLESVLNLLVRPMQLAYLVEDDVLKITTSTRAAEKLITRTYPVHDLYRAQDAAEMESAPKQAGVDKSGSPIRLALYQGFAGEGEKGVGQVGRARTRSDLVGAILTAVDPDSWEALSGPGSISYVESTGSLVIRQTWAVHRRVLQLLRDLREAKGKTTGDKQ
jgi:hypothetical protein